MQVKEHTRLTATTISRNPDSVTLYDRSIFFKNKIEIWRITITSTESLGVNAWNNSKKERKEKWKHVKSLFIYHSIIELLSQPYILSTQSHTGPSFRQ